MIVKLVILLKMGKVILIKYSKKTKIFPFAPKNKVGPQDRFTKHVTDIKPDVYRRTKKLICDSTDKNR